MIDHSLLHPAMTDEEIQAGLDICKKYRVATACVKPYSIAQARESLDGSGVGVCAVIGFPHGNSTTGIKVAETEDAMNLATKGRGGAAAAAEIDMVINIGKALSGEWSYVREEIQLINDVVTGRGGLLKVIVEIGHLPDPAIVKLCQICVDVGVAFIKTSTGYAFGYHDDDRTKLVVRGANIRVLELIRDTLFEANNNNNNNKSNKNDKARVEIKAAGGVRTLDHLLVVRALGVTRVGATATVAILEEAIKRGIPENEPVDVPLAFLSDGSFKPLGS